MSYKDNVDVILKYQKGNANAADQIIKSNKGLVHSIVNRFDASQRDDLVQEGNIALLEAAKRYDPNKGKFSTYAAYYIKKGVFEHLNSMQAIKLPGHVREIKN